MALFENFLPKSVFHPPPTLRETVAAMWRNVEESARAERAAQEMAQRHHEPGFTSKEARKAIAASEDEATKEKLRWFMAAWNDRERYRAEQVGFREQFTYYRWLLRRAPELADKPVDVAIERHGHEVPPPEERDTVTVDFEEVEARTRQMLGERE